MTWLPSLCIRTLYPEETRKRQACRAASQGHSQNTHTFRIGLGSRLVHSIRFKGYGREFP